MGHKTIDRYAIGAERLMSAFVVSKKDARGGKAGIFFFFSPSIFGEFFFF